jgi:hypothetical protein
MKQLITPLVLLLATCLLWSSPRDAAAAESYDNCSGFITSLPAVVTTQGVWCLDRHLETAITSGSAITINTNNVTIDCNDFKLGGLQAGVTTLARGITANGRLNTTVRNCNVRGFGTGIDASGGGIVVEDNRFELNTRTAVDVAGDGSVVRRNLVNDTGGAPDATVIYGILASNTVVVEDNIVTNVAAAAGTDTTVYGLRVIGGNGAVVSRNSVRGLIPSGTGVANGIYTSNGASVFITGNRASVTPAGTAGSGFRCNGTNGSMKDNGSWGFATPTSGCLDDGGNFAH